MNDEMKHDKRPVTDWSHIEILRYTIEMQKEMLYEHNKNLHAKPNPMDLLRQYHKAFQN